MTRPRALELVTPAGGTLDDALPSFPSTEKLETNVGLPSGEEKLVEEEDDFPEGGLKGWLNVLGASLVMLCIFGYANAFGVFQSYYQLNQFKDQSASSISWIGSVQSWLEFSFALVTGPLYDRGYFRTLLTVGSIIYIISLFMVSLCTEFWQAMLAQALGMGLGMGLLFLPAMSVLAQYFRVRRSLVMGLAMGGSSIGGVSFPIMLNRLFVTAGFEAAVRASGYVVLGCLIVANLCLSQRITSAKRQPLPADRPSILEILRELPFSLTVGSAFLISLAVFFPIAYLQVFFVRNNLPENISLYSLAILNASSFFGRIIPNALADYFGLFTTTTAIGGSISVLCFAMFGATSTGGAVTFAILFGFVAGAYVSLLSPLIVSLAKHHSEIGIRQGIAFSILGLSALIGTPIAGALLARNDGEFTGAIIFAGCCSAVGSLGMATARFLRVKEMGTWRV